MFKSNLSRLGENISFILCVFLDISPNSTSNSSSISDKSEYALKNPFNVLQITKVSSLKYSNIFIFFISLLLL